jgi:ADP-ribose pyrophosphatase
LGEFYLAPGYSDEFMVVYLASGLSDSPLDADEDEFVSVEAVPIAEAIRMAERGEIPDAKSLAALFLARSALDKWR